MITKRVQGLSFLHCLAQGAGTLVMFWIWVAFHFGIFQSDQFHKDRYAVYSAVLLGAFLIDFTRSQVVKRDLLQLDMIRSHAVSLKQLAVVVGTLVVFLVAAKDGNISRRFLFTFIPALYAFLLLSNRYFPRCLAENVFRGKREERTILLGSRNNARKLAPWLQRKAVYGFRAIGLICDVDNSAPGEPPHLGGPSDIPRILAETKATQVILLDLPMSPREIAELGNICDNLGVRLLIVNDLEDKLHRTINFMEDDGFHFIGFRQEPLECPVGRLLKRALDVFLSLPVVLFVLPVTHIVVWSLHRTQAPGPLFFRQKRNGRYNRVFDILKYRTMYVNNGDEGKQATSNDPRIFAAGSWMRRFSVDELPQFLNVLKGEMSIVGPRPHFVDHDTLFGEIANYYRVRSFIKPGITGLAQVRGLRGEATKKSDLVDRIHSDLYYLENWSLLLDSIIIGKTAWQMLMPPKTAY